MINGELFNAPISFNANIKHYLTPFGYSINTHFYFRQDQRMLFVTLNHYNNKNHFFPGLSLAILSVPNKFGKFQTKNSIEISVWNQPKKFSFTSASGEWGGRASVHSEQVWSERMSTFIEMNYKTEGWVAGELYLDENLNFIAGVSFQIGKAIKLSANRC